MDKLTKNDITALIDNNHVDGIGLHLARQLREAIIEIETHQANKHRGERGAENGTGAQETGAARPAHATQNRDSE